MVNRTIRCRQTFIIQEPVTQHNVNNWAVEFLVNLTTFVHWYDRNYVNAMSHEVFS